MAVQRPTGRRRKVPGADSQPKPKRPANMVSALPPQTEREFQEAVLKFAHQMGWRRTYHTWTSMHSTGGFPDLVLVRRPRIVFAELKSQRRDATADQTAWLDDLRACGLQAFLWKPSDWDEIVKVLSR